jgi:hypothetical protein
VGQFWNGGLGQFCGGGIRTSPIEDIAIPSVARQLAAMSSHAPLYTTNYDPVLELAVGLQQESPQSNPAYWAMFRAHGESAEEPHAVRHMHGWVDPDGHWGGSFVLADSHYLGLQLDETAPPNRMLRELLNGDCAVLIVGMSLSDANLRRILWQRARSPFATGPTYAVVKAAGAVADRVREQYWKLRRTFLLPVPEYADALTLLRDVQFGQTRSHDKPNWLEHAGEILRVAHVDWASDAWQRAAWAALREARDVIRQDSDGDGVELSLFRLDTDNAELAEIATTKPGVAPTGESARARSRARVLSVRGHDEQGAAGSAFVTGIRQAPDSIEARNLRFTPEMMASWSHDFEALLATPIFASRPSRAGGEGYWVCVGVIVATSTRSRPRWMSESTVEKQLYAVGERLLLGRSR